MSCNNGTTPGPSKQTSSRTGISLDLSPRTQWSLLREAVRGGDLEQFDLLVDQGANPLARWIIERDPPGIDDADSFGEPGALRCEDDSLLFIAISKNPHNDAMVERLLALGETPNHIGQSQISAFALWAASGGVGFTGEKHQGWTRTGMLMLEAGANPELGTNGRLGQRSCARRLAQSKPHTQDVLTAYVCEMARRTLDANTEPAAAAPRKSRL